MNISGMLLELSSKLANYVHPKMPGADGPQPQLSSGVRTLNLIEEGTFVDMMGKTTVKALNGCWEMIWREDNPAGSLICGFDIPEEYHRNDASLPKGRAYVNFPIWTKSGLKEAQETKERMVILAKELMDEKMAELEKMQATSNPFTKVLHYHNALACCEKLGLQDSRRIEAIPSNDEIIALQDDLLLSIKGFVFSKEKAFSRGQRTLLGTAFASAVAAP